MGKDKKALREDVVYTFGDLYAAQNEFQKRIQEEDPTQSQQTVIGSPEFIRLHTLALTVEAGEALNETPWKPWKKNQDWDKKAFKEELIDIQVFLMNLYNAAGMTEEDIMKGLASKININHGRQDNDY